MHSAISLIVIISKIFDNRSNLEDPLIGDIMKIVVELIQFEHKTINGQTLLHLCVNHHTNINLIFMPENFE